MASNRSKKARERARRRKHAISRKAKPLLPPQILPTEIEYEVDQCRKHKILVPENLESQHAGSAAFRVLRTRFLQRARSHQWTSIGISSPGQGEGKSVTSLNLAVSVAQAGNHNVYLIDLDLRRPKIWNYLGAEPPREITDYLTGEAPVEDVLFSIGIENLTIAGALTGTNQASELLSGPRVSELFSYINSKTSSAMILLDLPPLLSTDDALIMGAKVDACLLVVAEGVSSRDGTAKALELLEDFPNIAGVVLNRSNTMVSDYYTAY